MTQKQKDHVRSQLRIPVELHAKLTAAAERNGRSLNAEILARLEPDPIVATLEVLKQDNAELKFLAREILQNLSD
jgi:hypothetical protein